jgi:hypothetical protein
MRARERSPMLRGACALALLAGLALGRAGAQTTSAEAAGPAVVPAVAAEAATPPVVPAVAVGDAAGKGEIQPTSCASCGGGLLGGPPAIGAPGGCGAGRCNDVDGCGPPPCYAGKEPCDCGQACARDGLGGTLMGIYQCICCNDPCYEPRWIATANSAFWIDGVRPVTQMKLGTDFGWDLTKPDKAELFWAQANKKGPQFTGGGTKLGPNALDYARGYMVNEAAIGGVFSIAIETSILHTDPDAGFNNASGFADMSIATKNMVLDCELLQVAFQFKTYLPTGNFTRGLGTGHTSLEPSLIAALKLTPESYLQGQILYRFPIGGTDGIQGSLVWGALSYNRQLWHCGHDIELIGSLEANFGCTTYGQYTDPSTGILGRTNNLGGFFNVGPGVRLVLCKKVDFGVAASFAITDETLYGNTVRAEFRWRF